MRVLITGSTGLIGKEVGKRLAAGGHQLTVTTRNPERAKLELPFPARIVRWKGENEAFPQDALTGIEGIIHLAGEPVAGGRWTPEKKTRIYNSRVLGTKRLIDAIASSGLSNNIKVLVAGSATGIYGSRGDDVLEENAGSSEKAPDFLSGVVTDWEKEADRFQAETQGRLVKVRTGVVLARHGGAMEKLLPLFQRGLGGRLGNGQQWMSWIHIDDIARLFVFALENNDVSGVLNGVSTEPARNERFTIALARAIGRPVFLPVPETALKLALGEMASALLGSQRIQPARTQQAGFTFTYPELSSALEEICQPLRGGHHELLSEQWVDRRPEEVFPYFSSETNLEQLTPQFLNFKVIGKSTPEIKQGTLIDYRLSVHGIPVKWRTRIEKWDPNRGFADVQLRGPYSQWHHTHEFIPSCGGTLLRDRVLYKIPLGWVGDVAAGWKVSSDVAQIFAFRREKIARQFGGPA